MAGLLIHGLLPGAGSIQQPCPPSARLESKLLRLDGKHERGSDTQIETAIRFDPLARHE
jgi:hypothetical protein